MDYFYGTLNNKLTPISTFEGAETDTAVVRVVPAGQQYADIYVDVKTEKLLESFTELIKKQSEQIVELQRQLSDLSSQHFLMCDDKLLIK